MCKIKNSQWESMVSLWHLLSSAVRQFSWNLIQLAISNSVRASIWRKVLSEGSGVGLASEAATWNPFELLLLCTAPLKTSKKGRSEEHCCCCCCQVPSVVSDPVRPHRRQPTRLLHPWDYPGKNTGVGCHFLLQCIKVKSEVSQSCPTLHNPMDCSLSGFSVHGSFQAGVLEWVAIAFSAFAV